MAITCVWIEDGCITCGACEGTCPEVFSVGDESSRIRAEVREDGILSPNREEKSPLKADATAYEAGILDAASGCPVEVIKTE